MPNQCRPNHHTHQHTRADTQEQVNITAGVLIRIIDKEEREGALNSAGPGTVT